MRRRLCPYAAQAVVMSLNFVPILWEARKGLWQGSNLKDAVAAVSGVSFW